MNPLVRPGGRVAFTTISVAPGLDVTGTLRRTQAAWMDEVDRHQAERIAIEGAPVVRRRRPDQRAQLPAVDDGLWRRGIFTAAKRGGLTRPTP